MKSKWYVCLTIGVDIGPFRSEEKAWNFIYGKGVNAIDPARKYLNSSSKPYQKS